MSAPLMTRGIIHSVSDPYATSLLVADGLIAWLGGDDTAAALTDDRTEVLDLDGAVVAPGFVAPLDGRTSVSGALRRGVTMQTVLDGWAQHGAPQEDGHVQTPAGLRTVRYRRADAADPGAAGVWLGVAADDARGALAGLVVASTQAGEQVYLVPTRPHRPADEAAAVQAVILGALRDAADRLGASALGRVRPRLMLDAPVDAADRALLAAVGASVTVAPDGDGVLRAPLNSLLAQAVPVALGVVGEANPWSAVRAALAHPDEAERISARSAFSAATRTGLRALPDVPAAAVDAAPRLTVTAPATFALWRAEAVTVQSPDGRVAAWSTDTRAGTPLLPALDAETSLPTWEATWVDGAVAAQADA